MRWGLRLAATFAAAVGFPAAAGAPPTPKPKPQRIMSMNQCADLLLLQIVPRSRIAAVTYLAHDGAAELFPGADAGIPINYGTAEDIIRYRPDLILAGDFSTKTTRRLARQIGAPIVEIHSADTFDDIRAAVRQVGAATGETARAEALVRRMDADLAALARTRPARPVRVVAWSDAATVPGQATLTNVILQAAGAVNVAAPPGGAYTTFDTEELLQANPEALLFGGEGTSGPSPRSDAARHRVVRRLWAGRTIGYGQVAYACGLPQSVTVAVSLRRALAALPARPEGRR